MYFAFMAKYLVAALAAIIFLASCRSLKDPVFNGIENVSVGEIGLDNSLLTLNLKYFNPNSSGGKLKNASGNAWMDDTYLGHFTVDSTVHIPAKDSFLIPVKLAVDMKKLLKNSFTALFKKEVMIRIEGEAKAGKGGFYRKFPVKYEGKQDIAELFQ
ncbi:MAG: hypothetical protein BGO52_16520 [Sphingobacteriales bacterium 44-61]|nr:MAG: hypothetical protein BGO52_16520 [Sphingobacteriales bacterium 44-61]